MVNSIIDGMNLVAKEGCLLNERNGVLILSEGAGAAVQLGDDALMIAPADVEGTADAIYHALTMPLPERRRRADNLRRAVESDDVAKWFREQIWDLDRYAVKGERDPGAILPEEAFVAVSGTREQESATQSDPLATGMHTGN